MLELPTTEHRRLQHGAVIFQTTDFSWCFHLQNADDFVGSRCESANGLHKLPAGGCSQAPSPMNHQLLGLLNPRIFPIGASMGNADQIPGGSLVGVVAFSGTKIRHRVERVQEVFAQGCARTPLGEMVFSIDSGCHMA